MKQGLLPWSPRTFPGHTPPFLHLATTFKPKFSRPNCTAVAVTLSAVEGSSLTARERIQMRKENRESKPAYNWREEVEDRLIKKPKKRYASWTEELNLDNLALLGPQWWVVRVSRVSGQDTVERWLAQWPETFLVWILRCTLLQSMSKENGRMERSLLNQNRSSLDACF